MAIQMTELPQEVIDNIASCLQRRDNESAVRVLDRGPSKLPSYATISKQWQFAIEIRTFREVKLKSPDVSFFSRIMNKDRRAMLQYLEVEIVLPTYSDKACAKFENKKDRKANNEAFTTAVKDLLGLLRSWHTEDRSVNNDFAVSEAGSLKLLLHNCYSPMDSYHRGKEKYRADKEDWDLGRRHDLFEHRYESSIIRLDDSEEIGTVPQISQFDVSQSHRKLEPRSVAVIASKFPRLKSINWTLAESERKDAVLRQQMRYDFAKSLLSISSTSIKKVTLDFWYYAPFNQAMNPPNGVPPTPPSIDHLSLALHNLSLAEHLTNLTLGGGIVISEAFFWPEEPDHPPFWPQLLNLEVEFNMTTAEGGWFFIRCDEEEESEEEEQEENVPYGWGSDNSASDSSSQSEMSDNSDIPDAYHEKREERAVGDFPGRLFRDKADATKLNPFFAGAARAATQMPRLQRMTLVSKVQANNKFSFRMSFFAPGQKMYSGPGARDVDMARLVWAMGSSGYTPEESTVDIWRQAQDGHAELLSIVL